MRVYQSPTRYYTVAISRDLFGQIIVDCRWGGIESRRGGGSTTAVDGHDLRAHLRDIHKRRLAHGYRRI